MADAAILREYLVKLAYSMDGASESRFKAALSNASSMATAAAASILAASTAINGAVMAISLNMDQLYWSSQRAGTSVSSIRAIAYAVSQLGGSADSAAASIDAMGQLIRRNPGYESLIRNLGVTTRENGKLRDTGRIMIDLGERLRSLPYSQAARYAQELNIDEGTLRAVMSGGAAARMREHADKLKALGVDEADASQKGNALTSAWRNINDTLAAVGLRLQQELSPELTKTVTAIDDFIKAHPNEIVEFVRAVGRAAREVGTALVALAKYVSKAWHELDALARRLTGESGLTVLMTGFAVYIGGKWTLAIASALFKFSAGWSALLLRFGVPLAVGALAVGHGFQTPEQYASTAGAGRAGGDAGGAATGIRGWIKRNMPTWLGGDPSIGSAATPPANHRKAAQEAYEFWRSKGLSHHHAVGLVAMEDAESKFDPGARGDANKAHGLFQHHPDRRAAILAGTGIDISTATPAQQREATFWELTKGQERRAYEAMLATKTAGEAAATLTTEFLRPANKYMKARDRAMIANGWDAVLAARDRVTVPVPIIAPFRPFSTMKPTPLMPYQPPGLMSSSISQKTEITILGSGDAAATAEAVADRMGAVNKGLEEGVGKAIK